MSSFQYVFLFGRLAELRVASIGLFVRLQSPLRKATDIVAGYQPHVTVSQVGRCVTVILFRSTQAAGT